MHGPTRPVKHEASSDSNRREALIGENEEASFALLRIEDGNGSQSRSKHAIRAMAAGADAAFTLLVERLGDAKVAHDDAKGQGLFTQIDLEGTIDDVFTAIQHSEHIRKEMERRSVSALEFITQQREEHYRALLKLVTKAHERTLLPPKDKVPAAKDKDGAGANPRQSSMQSKGTSATLGSKASRLYKGLQRRAKEVGKALAGNPEQLSKEAGKLNSVLSSKLEGLRKNTIWCTTVLNSHLRDHGQRSLRFYIVPPSQFPVSDEVIASGHAVWNDESIVPTA